MALCHVKINPYFCARNNSPTPTSVMKISIITVCYNNLEGLKLTAESIAKQTSQDFEWIVIDGASTDGTATYLQQLTRKADILVSEPDKGIYDAMNKGMNMARGEYQLYLNSGDYLHDENVIKALLAKEMTADVVYGDLEILEGTEKRICQFPHKITPLFLLHSWLGHPSSLIRTEALRSIGGYDLRYRIVADWRLWMYFCLHDYTFEYCGECISTFVMGGISSTQMDTVAQERNAIVRELFASAEHNVRLPRVNAIIPFPKGSNKANAMEKGLELNYYPNLHITAYLNKRIPAGTAKYTFVLTPKACRHPESIARRVAKLEEAPHTKRFSLPSIVWK